ncbi:MAG: chromosome segregation protein SMC [Planctomycetota bacterium]|jgi:chromosome segregation protein
MKLKKIVLNGFKSFADKTEFCFDSPITAIVGPNGCGKSNVVDAVKWVLGEQSAKSLRGGHMSDVIFSGSSSRKALGTAEVSLVVSNPDGMGNGKLSVETDEVQITRRIFKSGESEYRINNKICRLKDIRELFMDTGVGARAYSILEQGQIDRILSLSKTERRTIFEDAAGISKYKAHKKEALRKLERTEQNLLRLADILNEVGKQLRSVKLQAGKARSYLKYTQRLKELQVNYSLAEYAKNQQQLKEKENALERVHGQFEKLAAEVTREDNLMSELGRRIIETENKLNRTDNSIVGVQSRIEQKLQRIEFLHTRIEELQQRKESAGERVNKLREQENFLKTDTVRLQQELVECEEGFEEKSREVEQVQQDVQRISAECTSLEANLEDEKSGVIDIVRRTAQLHNEIQSISVYRDNLSSQKDRLSGRAEHARTELEKMLTEKAQHKTRLDDIEIVLSELAEKLESKRKEREEVKSLIAGDNRRLAASREARSTLSGELAILTDMEKRREGLTSAVKDILENRSVENNKLDYVEGVLADIVAADFEYASAVEAGLEGKTDALVVNSTRRLLADTEADGVIGKLDGRVNFLCLDRTEPFVDSNDLSSMECVKGRLVEFLKYDSKFAPLIWKLVGKTIVVDSLESAVELGRELGGEYQFVTLEGELLSGDGSIKLGPLGKTTGLISRKSRVRQLQQTIANTTSEIETLEEQIEKNNQTSMHLEQLCKDLRTAVYEANTEKMQVNSKISVSEQNINRLRQEQPLITSEIDLLETEIAGSVKREYDSKQKLDELEAVNSERTQRIEELESKYAEQKVMLEKQTSRLTDLKVALGQITEQRKGLKQTIGHITSQMQANQGSADSALAEIQSCGEELTKASRDILESEATVSQMYVEKEKTQESTAKLHKEVNELIEEQKQTEHHIRERRAEKSEMEATISELRIEAGQLQVKGQDLVERVQDELQIDLVAAYEDYNQSEVDWEQVREEITELRARIERLGNVNLDAIDEQESLEERHEFLSKQVEDLNLSRAQLQQLINRLNKKSREKFGQTFEEIRVHFQEVFRRLFGGGKADMFLEEAEDILEAGVEIMARPPGKQTRSISLLSGGEKSLTAIALLFAIFKTKPSPFCFLDEIDAALDEANNERFNLMVREFQKNSQFVIITHAKRTMSIADVLFGITMQTKGVSKKISVRFDKFDEEEETVAVA